MQTEKNFQITSKSKLFDLIIELPYIIVILENFGIELPVQEKTINEVCEENNISTELFIKLVNLIKGNFSQIVEENNFSNIKPMVNYLRRSHDFYLDEKFPKINTLIIELNNISGKSETQLVEKFFNEYFNEVLEHFTYENEIVFPYVLNLYETTAKHLPFKSNIRYSVEQYKDHHNDIEEKLSDIKNLLIKYLPSKNDIKIRRNLLFSLFELEFDLNIHSKIEDLILIPLVESMEQEIAKLNAK